MLHTCPRAHRHNTTVTQPPLYINLHNDLRLNFKITASGLNQWTFADKNTKDNYFFSVSNTQKGGT